MEREPTLAEFLAANAEPLSVGGIKRTPGVAIVVSE